MILENLVKRWSPIAFNVSIVFNLNRTRSTYEDHTRKVKGCDCFACARDHRGVIMFEFLRAKHSSNATYLNRDKRVYDRDIGPFRGIEAQPADSDGRILTIPRSLHDGYRQAETFDVSIRGHDRYEYRSQLRKGNLRKAFGKYTVSWLLTLKRRIHASIPCLSVYITSREYIVIEKINLSEPCWWANVQ